MNHKSNKPKLFFGILLILLGLLTAYFVIAQENQQNRENTVVEATVTSCILIREEYDIVDGNDDRTYFIGVKYTYNGENYESSIDYSSQKKVGQKIKIHINPDNPVEINGMYGGLVDYLASVILGVPIIFIGVCLIDSAHKNRKQQKQCE